MHAENAGQKDMEAAIRNFGKRLHDGGVGLFYFAGHGMQVNGRNYLIPADAEIETESDVRYEAVDAGRVLGKMEDAGNEMNIVILDACRDNPFTRNVRSTGKGLVQMESPKGSIIAYSTGPGAVAVDGGGRNSVYTKHLLNHMTTSGITIEQVFKRVRVDVISETAEKQIPWESSSLTGDFYFASGAVPVSEPPFRIEPVETLTTAVRLDGNRSEIGKPYANTIGMTFVYMPPGSFMMGNPSHSPGGDDDEKEHPVNLTDGFYIQTTEVTVEQWRMFVRETAYVTEAETGGGSWIWTGQHWTKKDGFYWDNPGFPQTDKHPATCISWNDARAFIRWLSRSDGKPYRLPNEAEWEYACKARGYGRYREIEDNRNLKNYAWFSQNSRGKTHPVSQLKHNGWGLYDMRGNVWEWCEDWYGEYAPDFMMNPKGSMSGSNRVIRGGGWNDSARACRSSNRGKSIPLHSINNLGFRLAVPVASLL